MDLSILCLVLVSRECACLPARQWTPQDKGPAFLVWASQCPARSPLQSAQAELSSFGKIGAFLCLRRRSRKNRNLCSNNLFFRTETCSETWRFHSTLFIWKKSTFFITPLTRRNPTLGGNSFQSQFLLALVILAHSGLRSQLGIVGPNRSLAPEMLWNFYKVISEAGD